MVKHKHKRNSYNIIVNPHETVFLGYRRRAHTTNIHAFVIFKVLHKRQHEEMIQIFKNYRYL